MNNEIIIDAALQNRGIWLKVNIPQHTIGLCVASILDSDGNILKQVALERGSNAIDISHINTECINIKVETEHETILKKIKLSQQ